MESAGEEETIEPNATLLFKRQLQTCGGIIILPLVSSLTILRERRKMWEYGIFVSYSFFGDFSLIGDLLGTLIGGFSLYYMGRKNTLIITNVLFLLPLMSLLTETGAMLNFVGVLTLHFAIRFLMVAIHIYVAEICHPKFRALFLGLYCVSNQLGILMGTYLEVGSKLVNIIAFLLIVCSLVHSTKIPETPYWLALTNRREEAEQVFEYLHGDEDNEEATLTFDKAEIDAENKSLKTLVLSPFYTPLLILFFMLLANNSMCFFLPFIKDLFDIVPSKSPLSSLRLLLENVLPVLGSLSFLGLCLIASRRLVFFSSIVLSFIIVLIPEVGQFHLLCYLFQYTGAKQLTRIVPIELFPGPTRDIGLAFCDLLETSILHIESYSMYRDWLYNILSKFRWVFIPLGIGFTFFFMPETKDLPLAESEELGNELVVYFTFETPPEEEVSE